MERVIKKIERVTTLDLLRGYFLVAIILNHLYYYPNGFDWVAARGELFITTAEGFVFISGIVLGIVRGRKLVNMPFRHVAKLLLQRSFQLYLVSIALVLIFTLVGWQFIDNSGLKYNIASPDTSLWQLLWNTITLQYTYGWADYLRLYALFIAVSPLFLWLLRKNLWWLGILFSIIIWAQFPGDPNLADAQQELLQPISWQLLFFSGMTIGFYWPTMTEWWQARATSLKHTIVASGIILSLYTLILNVIGVFLPQYDMSESAKNIGDYVFMLRIDYFDKEMLPILSIALFFVWFWTSYWLFHRFEPAIKKYTGWLLLSFGQNALYVYTLHAFVIFYIHLFIQKSTEWYINLCISLFAVGLIYIAVRTRFLMKIIPR